MDLIYQKAKSIMGDRDFFRSEVANRDHELAKKDREIKGLRARIHDLESEWLVQTQTPQEPDEVSVRHSVLEKTEETGAPIPNGVDGEGYGFPPLITVDERIDDDEIVRGSQEWHEFDHRNCGDDWENCRECGHLREANGE